MMIKRKQLVIRYEAVRAVQWTGENEAEVADTLGLETLNHDRLSFLVGLDIGDYLHLDDDGQLTAITKEEAEISFNVLEGDKTTAYTTNK